MRVIDSNGHAVRVKPFNPTTSAVVTTNTAVDILSNVAGKRYFISKLVAVNVTTGQYVTLKIATDNATPVTVCYLQPGNPTAADDIGSAEIEFKPFYEVPAGETITAEGTAATTGDSYVTAMGYVEV